MDLAYCPTCRMILEVVWESPPYAVAHMAVSETEALHSHPITHEPAPSTRYDGKTWELSDAS